MQMAHTSTGPFVDGTIIPIQPETPGLLGHYNKMPIMGGTTKDEAYFRLKHYRVFLGPPPGGPDGSPIYGQQQRCRAGRVSALQLRQ